MCVPRLDKVSPEGRVHGTMQIVQHSAEFVVRRDGFPCSLDHGAVASLAQLLNEEHVRREGEVVRRKPFELFKRVGCVDDVVVFDHLDG